MSDLITREIDQYINASFLCKTSGKQFSQYLLLQSVQGFLSELSEILQLSIDVLIQKGEQGRGKDQATWVHPTVAVHLGQWLSPANAANAIAFLWQELESKKLAESLLQTKLIESSESIFDQQQQIKVLEPFKKIIDGVEKTKKDLTKLKNLIQNEIARKFGAKGLTTAKAFDILDTVLNEELDDGHCFKNLQRRANIKRYYRIDGVEMTVIRHERDLGCFLLAVARGYQTPGVGGSGQSIVLKRMFDSASLL